MRDRYFLSKKLFNRYNAAAWRKAKDGNTILMLREVQVAGEEGAPDKGKMLLIEVDHQGNIVHEEAIWHPEGSPFLLEDPRALVTDDGQVMIGLTAVFSEDCGYVPYPALSVLESTEYNGPLPQVQVFKEFGPGKNFTPIDSQTLLFRQEGSENNHKLLVIEVKGDELVAGNEIAFPKDIPWARWRIGTTMAPVWINREEALMLIHGITQENGLYIYSLGRARLYRTHGNGQTGFKIDVDKNPILTPNDFLDNEGRPMIPELHSKRRVVYSCGGLVKKRGDNELLSLFVNVGDKQTVEVPFYLNELKSAWW